MHALEDDPEQKTRGRRLLTGAGIAGGLAVTLIVTAQHIEPARRLMPEILQIAVVDDVPPPPPKDLPPPPPPPPPPKAKREEPKQEDKPVEQPTPDEQPAEQPSEAEAGLDSSSFGSGSGGVSFRTGTTQMGDPNRLAKRMLEPPKLMGKPPKLLPARALNPDLPEYPERARKLNIQGFVLLEADIDERGKLVTLRVRQGLERGLDDAALASVKRWRFQPATLSGRAVPSTRLIRIRFELN
jgi:protein TonB